MSRIARDILMHYGMPRRSGRYPWGSGDEPYQRNCDFIGRVQALRKQKMSEQDIAKSMGCASTTELRVRYSRATNERRAYDVARARTLKGDGKSTAEIGRIMNRSESSIRSLLNAQSEARTNKAQIVADFLKQQVDKKGMIDIGAGVERELCVSKEMLNTAVEILKSEGYLTYGRSVTQVTNPGRQTVLKVLCPPGTSHQDIYGDPANIHSIIDYKLKTDDAGNDSFKPGFVYPKSMDSSRLAIRYAEDGGAQKDGVIEIRRGVEDLSLGESSYAQVRILVDGNKYLKGMAIYSDDLPDGVDVLFNTNKKAGTPKIDVLKDVKNDPENPFGSLIKENGGQSYYTDKNGVEQLSLINKTRMEGDWNDWKDSLPSQFLAKQNMVLIRKQLGLAISDRQAEFDEICSLTNPTVKKELLKSFADDCDSAAVHLQAAALPRQKHQVILPISSLKDNEVYAPNYEDGETVALIRYPHGGTFEIPILTVNNKHADARRILGTTPSDAIGINSKVAERLSGADFDGDTVMVIPCNSARSSIKIKSDPQLKELEGFDPKTQYAERPGMTYMKYKNKAGKEIDNTQIQMGMISNLITDMTLKGAPNREIAKAVRHSMVVIDAAKHKLDYKQSEVDNEIAALKKRYQGRYDEDGNYHTGASTLISRAKSEIPVLKRKGNPNIDPLTGEQSYAKAFTDKQRSKEVYEEYTDEKGKVKVRMQKSYLMSEIDDARKLSSGTVQENAYAEYANKMKAFANAARKEMLATGKIRYDPSAKDAYAEEVSSLKARLNLALLNAPRERQAQLIANSVVKAKMADNQDLTREELRKIGQMALSAARNRVGAKRNPIEISDKEWAAIQAGAVSENVLSNIIKNADMDRLRQLATPRTRSTITPAKEAKIKAMKRLGYTTNEIAKSVGVSPSTVSKYISGKE